jgi:hypothetical protein
VLDEFYASQSHIEDAVVWLDGKRDGRLYCEHEPADIKKFERAGWRPERAEKSIDAGIAEVRQRLEPDRAATGERPGILISAQCDNLIREFLGYKMEHVGTSEAEDHALDALRYAIMTEATQERITIPGSF